jgi:hypothetical protein
MVMMGLLLMQSGIRVEFWEARTTSAELIVTLTIATNHLLIRHLAVFQSRYGQTLLQTRSVMETTIGDCWSENQILQAE